MSHKYSAGQNVYYEPQFGNDASRGVYKIVRPQPVERDQRLSYRIKSTAELSSELQRNTSFLARTDCVGCQLSGESRHRTDLPQCPLSVDPLDAGATKARPRQARRRLRCAVGARGRGGDVGSGPQTRDRLVWRTLVSRSMTRRPAIIVVMQRLHEDDLAGHLLDQGGWQHLDLPAIAVDDSVIPLCHGDPMIRRIGDILHPERESKDTLDRVKTEIGGLMFSAQYQQRPVPLEGHIIRREWFRYYDHLPHDSAKRIVQSWDIAMMTGDANDYSVCTTWWIIKADYYLVDVFRARLQYPDLRRKVASLAAKHGAETILIENAGPGMVLLQDLWGDPPQGMPRPIARKAEGSKVDRMVAQSAKIEAGHVLLPKEADWLDTFLHELLAFPTGRHDDQVDSVSQFLKWASSQRESVFDLTMIGSEAKVFVDGIQINPPESASSA